MEFQLISEFMLDKGLKCPSLQVLIQDHNLYRSLLYQVKGELKATKEYIGNDDKEKANRKLVEFFRLASNEDVELAATPEYSCPWNTIRNIIAEDTLPSENKLWIVGCESIKPRELSDFIEDHDDITWIYEENLLDENLEKEGFFDSVCYLFKTRTLDDSLRTVGIIQFKTHTMGGIELERDNMIRGEKAFVLRNDVESSRLFTLICSDSLDLDYGINLYDGFLNNPHLIIHLQLNSKPNHPDIRPYRGFIYSKSLYNKEVICLNWSRNTIMNGEKFNDYGGTAYYIKSDDAYLKDERLDDNFKLGLYYTYWKARYTNVYYLNYDEYVFDIQNTKPSQIQSPPANQNRTGPKMLGAYKWQEDNWKEANTVDSGFQNLCETMEDSDQTVDFDLLKNNQLGSTDIERLITLSTGSAQKEDWFDVKVNNFFRVTDEEKIQRITFTQTPCEEIKKSRKKSLHEYSFLKNTIIKQEENFPDKFQDLKDNCQIKYRPKGYANHYSFNIYPINTTRSAPASGIYIGQNDQSEAKKILDKMREKINDHSGKRIIIWYLDGAGKLQKSYVGTKPKTTDNPRKSSRDITS